MCDFFFSLLTQLPPSNIRLLQYLLCMLWHIAQHASENKMSSMNLAVCIGPTLLNPGKFQSPVLQQEVRCFKILSTSCLWLLKLLLLEFLRLCVLLCFCWGCSTGVEGINMNKVQFFQKIAWHCCFIIACLIQQFMSVVFKCCQVKETYWV